MIIAEEGRLSYLYNAILGLKNAEEVKMFLEDICTDVELSAISQRLHVARLLKEGLIYSDIVKATSASTATISRVNRSLRRGSGGYKLVLERKYGENPYLDINE